VMFKKSRRVICALVEDSSRSFIEVLKCLSGSYGFQNQFNFDALHTGGLFNCSVLRLIAEMNDNSD